MPEAVANLEILHQIKFVGCNPGSLNVNSWETSNHKNKKPVPVDYMDPGDDMDPVDDIENGPDNLLSFLVIFSDLPLAE